MRGTAVLVIAASVGGCNATVGATGTNPDANDNSVDAPELLVDAPVDAEILGAFGTPTKITVAATGLQEDDGTLSYSGLELVFAVQNAADSNRKDLFYTSRPDLGATFGPATLLPFSTIGTAEETPRFSVDDLTLFFAKTNGTNGLDIHRVTRPVAGSQDWSAPQLVGGVNGTGTDKWFMPCGGDRFLMIKGGDIAEGTLGGGAPVVVSELSSTSSETGTFLTQDCLTTYFASTRDGTNRIYTATRASLDAAWSAPVIVEDFAALGGDQQDPFIATDQRTFVFVSNADGTNDVYISTR
jgi:hypothetical protein